MRTLDLVVAALADYRLSVLVSKDQITEPVRATIGIKASGSHFWKFAADLVTCPYCLGVWFAGLIYLLSHYRFGQALVSILGIAGAQDLLQTFVDKTERNNDAEA